MNPSKPTIPNSEIGNISQFADFFADVRGILADARRVAYTAVNSAMVAAYWQIGRRIVEEDRGERLNQPMVIAFFRNSPAHCPPNSEGASPMPTFGISVNSTSPTPTWRFATHCVAN